MRASPILSIRIEYFPNPASGKSCFPVGRRTPESTMNMPATVLTDLVLLLLFLLLMAASHTGGAVHEWLGVLLTFALVLHAWLNRVWYKSLLKGRYNVTRTARLALNALLLLSLLGTLASAVPISRTVFAFLGLKGGLAARTIHVFCAHWCFLLAAVHLGVYGRRFCAPFAHFPVAPRPLGYRLTSSGLSVVFALYGLHAFFQRELTFPLTMQSSFMLWSENAALFLLDYGAVFFLFAWTSFRLAALSRTWRSHASLFLSTGERRPSPSDQPQKRS